MFAICIALHGLIMKLLVPLRQLQLLPPMITTHVRMNNWRLVGFAAPCFLRRRTTFCGAPGICGALSDSFMTFVIWKK